ncbi:RNA-binding protein [Catellatospora sp. IY07-71]|nr:RNA-binding protein [Catellatospora sp. IY07-71]
MTAHRGSGRELLRDDMGVTDIPIRDDMIRLGQFLKLAGVIETGGEAKLRIADGDVTVNGEVELRRGRQLHRGDTVAIDTHRLRVA